MFVGTLLQKAFGLPNAASYISDIVATGEVHTALDIGCGESSVLTAFRPTIRTIGIDVYPPAVETAIRNKAHDVCLLGDIRSTGAEAALASNAGQRFDLVTLIDVIEHMPKLEGYALLERCQEVASKFIVVRTPNGFVPQGPEGGNEYQCHHSGWMADELERLGFSVYGTTGTKYLIGYAGGYKVRCRGVASVDLLLGGLLRAKRVTRHAFNLLAIRDVRDMESV